MMHFNNMMSESKQKDLALLVLRLGIGAIFIAHGWQKIHGIDMITPFFQGLGFGKFLVYVVSYGEFIGGIALILGLMTRFMSLFLGGIMAVVLLYVKFGNPLIGQNSVELDLALFVSFVVLMLMGSGKYGVDYFCMNKKMCDNCTTCKDGVCTNHEAAVK